MIQKIAIIGAQNSGKTTSLYGTAYYIKRQAKPIGISHEVARDHMEMTREGFLGQLTILHRQMEREIRLERYYERIITDRSVFDSLAYIGQLFLEGKVSVEDLELVEKYVVLWAETHPYTALIYLKPLPIEPDPQRGEDVLKHQTEINDQFMQLVFWIKRRFPNLPIFTVEVEAKEYVGERVYEIIKNLFNVLSTNL